MSGEIVVNVAPMPQELFEAIADEFHRVHRLMAPGKDTAAAVGGEESGEAYVRRLALFAAFVSLLGPSDGVGILALKQCREMSHDR